MSDFSVLLAKFFATVKTAESVGKNIMPDILQYTNPPCSSTETLIICLKSGSATDRKPIGGYCISIEPIGPQGNEFLVHVQSSMSINGHFGGSKVISSATEKFHCLEEKRTEFVYQDDGLHEKTMFLGMEDTFYNVKLILTCPCDESTENKALSFCCNNRFISEGVNVLLMRYLALINYEGCLSFESINIDGESVMSNYNCTSAEHMELDGHFLSVYTIERVIHKEDGSTCNIHTYLTPEGRILEHNWLSVPYILKSNPMKDPKIIEKNPKIETPLRNRWSDDIEMFSKYLDMKYSKTAQQIDYLSDHPEVKHLIADYMQTLLVGNESLNWINFVPTLLRQVTLSASISTALKPANVIDFTIQHFKTYARNPETEETSISEKECYNVDLQSQLTKEKPQVVCSVCGFCTDYSMIDETFTMSSIEEQVDLKSSSDLICVTCSKCLSNMSHDMHGICGTSSSSDKSTSSGSLQKKCYSLDCISEVKEICKECYDVVKACQKDDEDKLQACKNK